MSTSISCPCSVTEECESIKNFTISVQDDLQHISEIQWNKHIPEWNVLMQHDSLCLLQSLQGNSIQFRYAQIKRNEQVVGVIYFQVVMFHANQLMNYFPETRAGSFWLKPLRAFSEKLLNLINIKLLVTGNVFMTGENGFYFNTDIDKPTRARIIRKTIDEIRVKDKSIAATLISDLYDPKSDFDSDFSKVGYHEITVESDMGISLKKEWKTFDDYLHSLSSKYRVRTRKVFNMCSEAGVLHQDLSADEIRIHQDRLYQLYERVISKADFKLAVLSPNFFYEQKKQIGANYRVIAYFRNGEIIGFISSYHFGKRMEVHYTGMDHDLCKPIHLYQHMMYDMIKYGIENRVDRIHFGRTAPEIKSTIGATPDKMYGYVKHFNPLFNFLFVRSYTAGLKPQEYVFRNPFKGS
ncbi:MAG: GNAT family N-acetyltransferase [Chitinophagales bacterium]